MKRLILTTLTSVLITIGAPSTALAGGGNYFPPVKTPVKAAPKTVAKKTATPAPACTGETAPATTVDSPSEAPVDQDQSGVWTLHLYSAQDPAKWAVYWTATPGITYDFEVSSSSATDPDTGKFVSPIAADHVSGNVSQSNEMDITNGQTFYFHLNATGSNGCPGKYVGGQITATYDPQVIGTVANHSDGPQATQLFGLSVIAALLFMVTRRYRDLRYGRNTVQNDELYV